MAIVFVAVLLLWCVLMLAGARFRENWRASAALQLQSGLGDQHTTAGVDQHRTTGVDNKNGEAARDGAYAAEVQTQRGGADAAKARTQQRGGADAAKARTQQRGGARAPEIPPLETLASRDDDPVGVPTRSVR